jgi:hypothetical protein
MALDERIHQYIQKLPLFLQAEVLDFVEYLIAKTERQEEGDWTNLSLVLAMRGMEDEATPEYAVTDLKVIFS